MALSAMVKRGRLVAAAADVVEKILSFSTRIVESTAASDGSTVKLLVELDGLRVERSLLHGATTGAAPGGDSRTRSVSLRKWGVKWMHFLRHRHHGREGQSLLG